MWHSGVQQWGAVLGGARNPVSACVCEDDAEIPPQLWICSVMYCQAPEETVYFGDADRHMQCHLSWDRSWPEVKSLRHLFGLQSWLGFLSCHMRKAQTSPQVCQITVQVSVKQKRLTAIVNRMGKEWQSCETAPLLSDWHEKRWRFLHICSQNLSGPLRSLKYCHKYIRL